MTEPKCNNCGEAQYKHYENYWCSADHKRRYFDYVSLSESRFEPIQEEPKRASERTTLDQLIAIKEHCPDTSRWEISGIHMIILELLIDLAKQVDTIEQRLSDIEGELFCWCDEWEPNAETIAAINEEPGKSFKTVEELMIDLDSEDKPKPITISQDALNWLYCEAAEHIVECNGTYIYAREILDFLRAKKGSE